MSTCRWCGNEVCIFLQFEADIVGLRQWHQRAAALGTNRERRKMAFRTFHRWREGIGGPRIKKERCVEVGVRSLFPDEAYMGFYNDEDRSKRRRAVNMMGEEIDAWWVFSDGGWVLEKE